MLTAPEIRVGDGVARSARPKLLAACLLAGALAGCGTTVPNAPEPVVATPASGAVLTERPTPFKTETLVGRWGVASYRDEKDRKRVEAQARAGCKLPYVIAKGPSDGVMMHAADDPQLRELRLKGASNGKTYLGFESPPGDWQDREILSFSDNLIVMRFVDPDANNRYGTFVYVRCPG